MSTMVEGRMDGVGPHRVLIVDDHPAIREGLAANLEPLHDLHVCGEAADAETALALLESTRPHLAVVDIVLKRSNGIELIKQMRALDSGLRVLVWSMYEDTLYALRALRAGAAGYLDKQQPTAQVVHALRSIASGQTCFPMDLEGDGSSHHATSVDILSRLSDREQEVFRLIGNGLTTSDIAARLDVSVKTIETHRQRIKVKLKFKNSVELCCRAVQWVLENG